MKLFHGSSELALESILKDGIKPRGKATGNWKHTIESNSNAVYLTNAYPLHFALSSTKGKERLLIVEVKTEELNPLLFAPDEDCLEQGTRKDERFAHVPGTNPFNMKTRTRWFRNRALKEFGYLWPVSLEKMGTCCYHGNIPPEAITRYSLVTNSGEVIMASDPVICPMNYMVMGPYYRQLAKMLFGEEPNTNELFGHDAERLKWMHANPEQSLLRGIEIKTL